MLYKDVLKQKIKELELEIANKSDHKDYLEKELNSLRLKEFEEEMREENQQLLKG